MPSWRKNGQDLAQTSRKWRKKISNGESDGERKIYPSANPGFVVRLVLSYLLRVWILNLFLSIPIPSIFTLFEIQIRSYMTVSKGK